MAGGDPGKPPPELVPGFRAARRAIRSLVEMLPSRVLLQEALDWLLEELFTLSVGTADPDAEQCNKIAEDVREGLPKPAEGAGNQQPEPVLIRRPENRVLSLEAREGLIRTLDNALEKLVLALRDNQQISSVPTEARAAYEALKDNGQVKQLINVLIPRPDGAGAEDLESTKNLKTSGAVDFFRTLIKAQVVPGLFSIPVLKRKRLLDIVAAKESASFLFALADGNPRLEKGLEDVGAEGAKKITEKTTAGSLDKNGLHSVVNCVVQASFEIVAKELGPKFRDALPLWSQGRSHATLLQARNERTIISDLKQLRGGQVAGAIANSPVAIDGDRLRCLVRAKVGRRVEKAKAIEEYVKACKELSKAARTLEETPLTNRREHARASADESKKRSQRSKAANKLLSYKQDDPDAGEDRTQQGEGVEGSLEATLNSSLSGAGFKDIPVPDPNDVNAFGKGQAEAIEVPEGALALMRLAGREDDLKTGVERIVGALKEEMVTRGVEGELEEYERQNSNIYAVYGRTLGEDEKRYFHRLVESTVFGWLLVSLEDRVGLGKRGSGLLEMLMDLLQETGKEGDREVKGVEFLSKKSLYSYLDGAHLGTGQAIKELRDNLKACACQSLENIRDFVSELHGLYFLFHAAPAGSRITVFNGSDAEFLSWAEDDNLVPGGDRKNRFGVVTSPGGNPNASHIDRPGLLYVSSRALDNDGDGERWRMLSLVAQEQHAYLMPPVLLSAPPVDGRVDWRAQARQSSEPMERACFPYVVVGPAFDLNPQNDALGSHLPAAYPVLARFLGATGDLGLNPNRLGSLRSQGRVRQVSGLNRTIANDLDDALTGLVDGHSLAADYYLYLVLALYADVRFQCGEEKWNQEKAMIFFRDWWQNAKRADDWVTLDKQLINGVSLKDCFLAPFEKPSACQARFSANFADANVGVEVKIGNGWRQVTDVAWFALAGNKLFDDRFPAG